ncbi:hypothetical protein ACGFZP_13145 [Kitasatospora sp. NPDC048239]|uniref:hypothetical protein n=1 Tax=Kitasatospora sp. NPDC048239 TaxID=3364046 RepID=UPI00371A8F36
MKRAAAVAHHLREAAALKLLAAQADGPGRTECLAQAQEHRSLAETARLGEYPTDLED